MVIMKTRKIKRPFKSKQKPPRSVARTEKPATNDDREREVIPKEIRIIAQEVQIVRSLACNDLNKRNRQLRKLRKWLQLRARSTFPITEESFLRIWKGLYYNMWMSDKPLVQEDLAEQLGKLIECFDDDVTNSVNFFGAFMQTMCNEWFGIDQWRIDKFMMLVRRMLRYMLRALRRAAWSKEAIHLFNEHMKQTVMAYQSPAIGLTMHYMDIFCEELAKASEGEISSEQLGYFVRPFVTYLALCRDGKLVSHCRKQVLHHLLYQSKLGREYQEKFNAWKEMGFPTTSIHDLERVEDGGEEFADNADEEDELPTGSQANQEKHLDPRAGNIDVLMPELPFDAKYIIDELEKLLYKNDQISTKVRKSLRKQLDILQVYQRGEFPLGVKQMPRFKTAKTDKPLMQEKIEQLENVENELFSVGRQLKQLTKRKRRKLLNSIKFTEVGESNLQQVIAKALPKQYLKERKRKANALMSGWIEEEINPDDTTPKKKPKAKSGTEKGNANVLNITENNAKENEGKQKVEKVKADVQKQSAKGEKTYIENKQTKAVKLSLNKNGDTSPSSSTVAQQAPNSAISKKKLTRNAASLAKSEWDAPLAEGEVEYFIPSRKIQLRNANAKLVPNPLSKIKTSTPVNSKSTASAGLRTPKMGSAKRVKIALKHNTSQNPSEYIRQIKSSPNLPYDAAKKPGKGLLKPNSMPSPINPFYKKKIGLRLANDTI